jgi:hypothetical protein
MLWGIIWWRGLKVVGRRVELEGKSGKPYDGSFLLECMVAWLWCREKRGRAFWVLALYRANGTAIEPGLGDLSLMIVTTCLFVSPSVRVVVFS